MIFNYFISYTYSSNYISGNGNCALSREEEISIFEHINEMQRDISEKLKEERDINSKVVINNFILLNKQE